MTMPAGTYWIGDLCYVMHDKWDEFCNDLSDGEREVQGIKIASLSTMYGDGSYLDQFAHEYGVDAGLIGCIRVDDIVDNPQNTLDGGHVFTFDYDFEVDSRDGLLIFGNIHIQTGDEDEECGNYDCTCYDDDLEEDEDDSLSIDEDRT